MPSPYIELAVTIGGIFPVDLLLLIELELPTLSNFFILFYSSPVQLLSHDVFFPIFTLEGLKFLLGRTSPYKVFSLHPVTLESLRRAVAPRDPYPV